MKDKHYLAPLLQPRSIGVIGASERPGSLGNRVLRNLLEGGFKGRVCAVNPKHENVLGVHCYPSVEDVPLRLDVALITLAANKLSAALESCGRAGVKTVVVMTSAFATPDADGARLERQLLEIARRHKLRLLGPGSTGIMRPHLNLNASAAPSMALKGTIGLISQSGALCAAVLDWAKPHDIGFSSVVSLGSSSDIDFGEVLEYLASDARTESIFLYVEGIRDARRFMSALRAAARVKPVLLIKSGRHDAVVKAIHAHSGVRNGDDAVFDAALSRSGVIRLYNLGQLFAAANALFSHFRPRGNRLAIVTNGAGPGFMAADRAADLGIPLPEFAPVTSAKLDSLLPGRWSHECPIDVGADADPTCYRDVVQAVLEGPNVDGVLVMLSPQRPTDPAAVARVIVELEAGADKPLVTCWMGEERVAESRAIFRAAGIPTFRTPDPAVELFSHVSAHYRHQKLLMQVPGSLSHLSPPSIESARLVIESALSEQREVLNEMESKACLAAFRIPIAQTMVARSATEAMVLAEKIGLPVVMKIDSPSIIHKADCGGVRLSVGTLPAVRNAYQEILDEVRRNKPDAQINGIAIEPMIAKRFGRELLVGAKRDEVFGPVITFGEGGNRVSAQHPLAVALPPLNPYLVQDLVDSSPVARMLGPLRNLPAVDRSALELVLLRVSEMVCELPWLLTLEINPLIVDENGAVAVDARITIGSVAPTVDPYRHMAIHPYPSNLVTHWDQRDGTRITIRPIKPEDAELEVAFVRGLSQETKYYRFMNTLRELSPAMVSRLTQIDYDREMAFIASVEQGGNEVEIGVCRYSVNPDGQSCEFAIVVADAWQHRGVARKLMSTLIDSARAKGLVYMNGIFLASNERMLRFVHKLGFVLNTDPEDSTLKIGVLALQD